MEVKFVNYQRDYLRFAKEYDAAWYRVNLLGDLILRKDVEEFEQRLADYVGTRFAIAVSNGTDAIYLSLKALGIKGGVAMPSHTFKSTCGAVINAGAKPHIFDLDNVIIESLINWKPGRIDAYIPVHIAGEISKIHNIGCPVIEDACQAFGAVKNPTTSAQCWSFYPAKILG